MFWWMRAQWQVQFGKEISAECFANMEVIRVEFMLDEKNATVYHGALQTKLVVRQRTNVGDLCWK